MAKPNDKQTDRQTNDVAPHTHTHTARELEHYYFIILAKTTRMNNFNTENADADLILVFGVWVNGLTFLVLVLLFYLHCSCCNWCAYANANACV